MKSHPQMRQAIQCFVISFLACVCLAWNGAPAQAQRGNSTVVRVFIFAGQSNMVGADSKAADVKSFPPFEGLEQPQEEVEYAYCMGRENKYQSDGWEPLRPLKEMIGPELSFARRVTDNTKGRIAIIKVAAGGTHLGGDWNPDDPTGFKMYPLALEFVRDSLSDLEKRGVEYRLEGFMWHQGENDMFNEEYKKNYGKNLKNFLACWRRDLDCSDLKFYIGQLCTKTIWGMDLRPSMDAITRGQRTVTESDPSARYVRTSHVGVEIGGGVGLHYHYGTLGQLEHGENYASAYLDSLDIETTKPRKLKKWPYTKNSKVKLIVFAGHRNMEGERAFVQDLAADRKLKSLRNDNPKIAYKFSIGGDYKTSDGWEPLGPAGYYDTFGPEVSFGASVSQASQEQIAIAKFTHSGSQIIDWTPEGSEAESRNLYTSFIEFVNQSITELEDQGHEVELAGIYYHVSENDMSFGPYRSRASKRVEALVKQSRIDLDRPELPWVISQQSPTDHESVNQIDVISDFEAFIDADPHTTHLKVFDLDGREKKLVISTAGIVQLGEIYAKAFLGQE